MNAPTNPDETSAPSALTEATLSAMDGIKSDSETARFVRELHARQLELEHRNEELNQVLRSISQGVLLVSPDQRIIAANQAFAKISGYPEAEILGRHCLFLHGPLTDPAGQQQLRQALEAGTEFAGELLNYRKDGSTFWNDFTIAPVLDAQGRLTNHIAITRDISQQKRAEQRLAAFATLGRRLNAATEVKSAARLIVEVAGELLGWDACTVELYDSATDRCQPVLRMDVLDGQRQEAPPESTSVAPSPRRRRTIEAGAQLILRQEPLELTPDEVPFGNTDRPSASIMMVPVRDREQVIGVLSIQSYRFNAYTPEDRDALQALADHCAGALHRLRVRADLQQERNLLRTIIDRLPGHIFVKDAAGTYLISNHAHTRAAGATSEATLIGKTAAHFFPPEMAARIQTQHDHIVRTGRGMVEREEPFEAHGRQGWRLVTVVPLLGAETRPVGVVGIIQDITARKQLALSEQLQTANALDASAQRHRAILDSALDAIVIMDAAGKLVEFNPAAEQMFGYTSAEVVGQSMAELIIPPAYREAHARGLARYLATSQPVILGKRRIEISALRRDGTEFPVELSLQRIGTTGTPLFTAFFRDISERVQTASALEASAQRHRAILDSALDAIVIMDSTGRLVEFNPAAEQIFGYTSAEAVGQIMADLIVPPAYREMHARGLARYVATGQGNIVGKGRIEITALRKDGTEFPVELSLQRIGSSAAPLFTAFIRDISERKQAEETVRRSELKFRTLFDSTGDAVVLLDQKGFFDCNQAALATFGCASKEEFCTKHPADLSPPLQPCGTDSLTLANQRIAAAMATGRQFFQWVHKRQDNGVVFQAEVLLSATQLDGRNVVQAVVRDISERKRAEEEQRATQQRVLLQRNAVNGLIQGETFYQDDLTASLRQLTEIVARTLDVARVSIWRYNRDRTAIQCVELYELAADRHSSGLELTAANYPAYFRAIASTDVIAVSDAHHDPRTSEFSAGYLTPLGINSMMDACVRWQGGVDGVLCHEHIGPQRWWTSDEQTFAVAITNLISLAFERGERMQAEAKLRESEERFRQLAEQSSEGFWFAAAHPERITYVSPAFEKISGVPANLLYQDARAWLAVIHPEDGQRVETAYEAALTGRATRFEAEYRVVLPDGSMRWVLNSGTPIRNSSGEIVRLGGLAKDITERRKLDGQVLRTQRLESIGTLAGGVAHDLNNALAPILMAVELLRAQNPDSAHVVDTIESSAKRGADMVKQLLTFAKGVEGARLLLQPTRLLKEMEKIVRGTFPKNIQLKTHYEPKLQTILGDDTQLHQVLLNLCVNARDAMPNGGTLTLEAENAEIDSTYATTVPDAQPGRYVLWRVKDTGTGIPPEIIERVFEPFFSTKGPDKGTGLGLSTVLGIVKSHGGFVRIYSVVGQGSTFAVYLPVDGSNAGNTCFLAKSEMAYRGKGETILVVDDEAAVREITSSVLTALNFRVVTAADGTEALIRVAENRAELRAVITDLHMPHMDGLSFVRVLRRMLPGAGIVVASGRLDEHHASEFQALGVAAILDKPFTQEKLITALKTIIPV